METFLVRVWSRRRVCLELIGTAAALIAGSRLSFAQVKPALLVFKDAGCDCCQAWVQHMQKQGYKATVTNTDMGPIKQKFKVPPQLQSCHTTLVDSYVIEGHVPASDVAKLLTQRPKGVVGLTIPGMPASAPGMDQTPFRPFSVLTFNAQGTTTVFSRHEKPGTDVQ